MQFKNEIEESLEQIRMLEECFRHARNSEILPISFFSTSYDIIKELAETLHGMEQGQSQFMQEQYIANKISFLEATDLCRDSEEEQLNNSFFPDNSFQAEKEKEKKDIHKEVKILADTRKYMSLNDKFRFQREIFMDSTEEMNKVFDTLNEFSILEEARSFIENQAWYNDSEIVVEFIELIEKRFS